MNGSQSPFPTSLCRSRRGGRRVESEAEPGKKQERGKLVLGLFLFLMILV